ncbi:hypothetical protein BDV25DRAFT_148621 [Aspergillus avenaceus]|uniref:Zn(2)-C6 fungal-type domain-containing protein n=1 Tax=Aspergillus avenaceus TaxID=36643 RepID=A0A5N6U5P5_ASPAV|nr:hypothetical protein BDV25DRAFT_148621 [Aspergillus avenaceus]
MIIQQTRLYPTSSIHQSTVKTMIKLPESPSKYSANWKANPSRRSSPRLCSACDACRQSRVKCTGGTPCRRCGNNGSTCHYSISLRQGRLKANRNQKSCSQRPSPVDTRDRRTKGESDTNTTCDSQNLSNGLSCDRVIPSVTFMPDFDPNLLEAQGQLDFNHPLRTLTDSLAPNLFLSSDSLEAGVGSSSSRDEGWSLPTEPNNFNLPLGQFDFGGPPRTARCSCHKIQLLCIGKLSETQDGIDLMTLESILEVSRQSCDQIRQELFCRLCTKDSTRFVLTTISLQHLTSIFGKVAKHGSWYVCNGDPVSFTAFEEENRTHKSLLVVSSLWHLDAVVDLLASSVHDLQYAEFMQPKLGEMMTETGQSNVKWVLETVFRIKAQLRMIIRSVEAIDWGRHTSGAQYPQGAFC